MLALCILGSLAVYADGEYNWYFKSAGDGRQPTVMDGSPIPDKYGAIYLGDKEEKVIYLTFDAGYGCESLDKILAVLKEEGVKATFFILPALIKYAKPSVLQMIEDGHLIANHTASHANMARLKTKDAILKEFRDLETYYRDETGAEMAHYYRPPEGAFSEESLAAALELGYTAVFWSFAYADWDNNKQKDEGWAYERIMSSLHDGMVLLLHPNSVTNAKILEKLITDIRAKGYKFGNLDELYLSQYGKPSSSYIRDNKEAGKCVALTFDDGPHPEYTPQILDILDKYGVKATFFVVGENAEAYPEIVRRIIDSGHEIGNHTWSHKQMNSLSKEQIQKEITKTQDFLKESFNYSPVLFRPPGGGEYTFAKETAEALGCKYVLWAWRTDSKDWACPDAGTISQTVLSTVTEGDIVLLHDYVGGKSSTPQAVAQIIPRLLAQGYSLDTVSGLLSRGSTESNLQGE